MSTINQATTITGEYSGFADDELRAISADFMQTTAMTAYQPAGSYLTADALDTVSADWNEVSAKLDTTAFSDVSGSFLTEVPNTYLQNTDLETADGKVTAISGIPLSAGGDVPEGVMVESGLDYDSSFISGYSGSAFKDVALTDVVTANSGTWGGSALPISAGPGIKVDLQNNTLVFSTDETVLYSGTQGTSACTLSEDLTHFDRLRFRLGNRAGTEGWQYQEIPAITSNIIHLCYNCGGGGNEYYVGLYGNMSSTTAINLTQCVAVKAPFSNTTATTTTGNNYDYQKAIFEVIGINRVAGGN